MCRFVGSIRAGVILLATVGSLALAASLASAEGSSQTSFVTPTPGPDGRIIYIVQDGDVLWTIAALSGKSVEEIMALNGLQPGDYLTPGMQLLLGLGGPVLPTSAPETRPTATLVPPTPTPVFGSGEICVILFNDVNGNAVLDEGELPLSGGEISISELSGTLAGEHTTDDNLEGRCFLDLLNGDYNVGAAAPADYNPTTAMNVPVRLAPGDIQHIEFGAQASSALSGGSGNDGQRSTWLGAAGAVLLLTAGGLGYLALRYNRRSPLGLR